MQSALRLIIPTLLSLVLAATAAAASRPGAAGAWADAATRSRALVDRGLTLDEAVARAEKRHGARAVRAEETRDDGRVVYRIRLLSADGRVFEVRVDARTGAFL